MAELNGIKRYIISLPVGETKTLEGIPDVATLIITEDLSKISGIILKRLTETSLVKGEYLSASSTGSTALVVYSESRNSITLKNNHTIDMSVVVIALS